MQEENESDRKIWTLGLLFLLCLGIAGCAGRAVSENGQQAAAGETGTPSETADGIDAIPEFSGAPYVELCGNRPEFTEEEIKAEAFETYSELDELGRCQTAFANICRELMPEEERGNIGMIKPSGWQTVKYDFVDGKYLYNRCHLIGYQLAGENANEKNLITGTRYMNVQGMLPFENKVAAYAEETGNHVLYRVTPVFEGDNLLAKGVRMEAYSVEDQGRGICFHVFVYNSQPGVQINYANGESSVSEEDRGEEKAIEADYILNRNTHKFHLPDCDSVADMKEKNKVHFAGDREEAVSQGYEPCKRCNP